MFDIISLLLLVQCSAILIILNWSEINLSNPMVKLIIIIGDFLYSSDNTKSVLLFAMS